MNRILLLPILWIAFFTTSNAQQHSVAREWNELLLESIRNDLARPTIHARNLFHTSIAMYDAWAAYDEEAEPFFLGKTIDGFTCDFEGIGTPANIEAAREEAISYAMFRLLKHRFFNSPARIQMFPQYDAFFFQLGYDSGYTSTDYTTGSAAALGNYIADQLIDFGLQDGSNEQLNYNNQFYAPVNPALVMEFSGNPSLSDPNRWQPLSLDVFIDQSGNVIPFNTPPFLSPEWGQVTPFALSTDDLTIYQRNGDDYYVYHDPSMPPLLDTNTGGDPSENYKWGFSMVNVWSSMLDPSDGVMWDISPASIGNMSNLPKNIAAYPNFYDRLNGGDSSAGHSVNPATGMPYAPQMVPRGDYTRVLAEFWADGPDSETPPGHWFTILNYVNDHPDLEKRFEGQGDLLNDLEWDVKTYFLLGGAMHDAAVCTWGIKGWYDYIRPVSAIRYMAELGQSSDPSLPNYHPGGFLLEPGLIELVEAGDPLAGGLNQNVGEIKILSWRGPDYINNPSTDVAGVGWILAKDWWPYQRPSFVTPNFAGYLSGHSTFSRAAAEMLTMITGDAYFPGGMGEFEVEKDEFLVFEKGPSVDFTLQWATYRDASDQTSLSRIFGGIHPPADDIPGRLIGIRIAEDAFSLGKSYFFQDQDQDGFYSFEDCDDTNALVNANQAEICDGIDNNCDGMIDNGLTINTYYRDSDGDSFGNVSERLDTCLMSAPAGYVADPNDCDDTNAVVYPFSPEICDGIDNDCSGLIDDGLTISTYYLDADGDSFGNPNASISSCESTPPDGYVLNADDCNDGDSNFNPSASEICDGIDNDCNGQIDDDLTVFTYFLDADGDSFGNDNVSLSTCQSTPPNGYVLAGGDCNDGDPFRNPMAAESCDEIDNNCNGEIDEDLAQFIYYLDADGDSFGDATQFISTCSPFPPENYSLSNKDCDDSNAAVNPAVGDVPDNNLDEDCDGVDYYKITKVFPNPTTGEITIHYEHTGDILLNLISMDGRLVREYILPFSNNSTTLDLSDLAQGVYLLRLVDEAGELYFYEKIIKD